MINHQNLQRESNLAQFKEVEVTNIALSQQDETKRIQLSQQLAQARADKETAVETKFHDSEYNQFLLKYIEAECIIRSMSYYDNRQRSYD